MKLPGTFIRAVKDNGKGAVRLHKEFQSESFALPLWRVREIRHKPGVACRPHRSITQRTPGMHCLGQPICCTETSQPGYRTAYEQQLSCTPDQ